jgi:ParB family chromosome partitioning protein
MRDVVRKGLSVRQTERLVQRLQNPEEPGETAAPEPDTAHVERDLAAQIGYRVKVSASPRGDGALTIWFNDLFQLDDLISRLSNAPPVEADED